MIIRQKEISEMTRGRGTYNLDRAVGQVVTGSGVRTGLCQIFVHHTSASLILCENADPDVRADLERFMAATVQDGDPLYVHTDEGPDDMSAHVRTVLTQNGITVPVTDGRCGLGTWQGIYLWEHRTASHRRRITVTVWGA